MAGKYDIPLIFTDYREMIKKGDLHAVIVSTPDDLHYPMTMSALNAGLHVLCEKPLANSASQASWVAEMPSAEEARCRRRRVTAFTSPADFTTCLSTTGPSSSNTTTDPRITVLNCLAKG